MKKILFAAVTLFLSIAPATFAQPPGRPPGTKPDTEKKDEPETDTSGGNARLAVSRA